MTSAADPNSFPDPAVLTVVIPTLGRRISAARTVRSILDSDYPNFRVILVDQSDAPLAQKAFPEDSRFEYVYSSTKGISAARNVGVSMAQDGIVIHTDDDCEAPPDWLSSIARTFESNPGVDLAYGAVKAGKTAPGGFIPAYEVKKEVIVSRLRSKHRIEGIGACIAYRRAVWEMLGGFDEALGAGAQFRSAEEVDFTVRALANGRVAMETPRFFVIHHGYRTWDNQDELLRGHLFGIGVTAAKQVRHFSPAYLYVLARLALRWAFGRPVVDFGRTPARLPRLKAFLKGFGVGWKRPMDEHGRFGASSPIPDPRPATSQAPALLVTPQESFPNLFIIGAPKSGTSSLYHHLASHPQVYMSPLKEPNFMAIEGLDVSMPVTSDSLHRELRAQSAWTLPEYVDLFRGATNERVIGEASSWYLHSEHAAANIRRYAPDSKLIAILRQPADRAYSAYRMHRRIGSEPLETFEATLARPEREFDWGLEYLRPGFYCRHLERYQEELRAGRLQIHLYEDLQQNPQDLLRKVFEFAGVDPGFPIGAPSMRYNESPTGQALSAETRERLIDLYRDDILGLQELLGRDLSAWLRL